MKNGGFMERLPSLLFFSAFAFLAHIFDDVPWRHAVGGAWVAWVIWVVHQEIAHLQELFSISDRQLVVVSQQISDLQEEVIALRNELEEVRQSQLFQ
jgi:hypothetical protein